jgi:hypothetical protein
MAFLFGAFLFFSFLFFSFLFFSFLFYSLVSGFFSKFHDLLLSYGTRYMNGPGSFGSDSIFFNLLYVFCSII